MVEIEESGEMETKKCHAGDLLSRRQLVPGWLGGLGGKAEDGKHFPLTSPPPRPQRSSPPVKTEEGDQLVQQHLAGRCK